MNGLEISRKFFDEVGFPLLKREVPGCIPYMAAGLPGGSQCHENDDEISRDHGWGGSLNVWLTGSSYDEFADAIRGVLRQQLPREYMGYPVWWNVDELGAYVKFVTGFESAPAKAADWLQISEEKLFEIMHRPIFYDGTGEVKNRFESFGQYPEDVWKMRLSACLQRLWAWGIMQHQRAELRGHTITASMNWSTFAAYAMKACFLLNRTYAPYQKWLYREFTKLPRLSPQINPLIEEGFSLTGGRNQVIDRIIDIILQDLYEQGYQPKIFSPEQISNFSYTCGLELCGFSAALRESVVDDEVRNTHMSWEQLCPPL